ncbi:hypothetical protein Mapa_008452 [Marchantia paleacea]|nr:hypothetical protein Mapa_008452 [Marchantia paleacea]
MIYGRSEIEHVDHGRSAQRHLKFFLNQIQRKSPTVEGLGAITLPHHLTMAGTGLVLYAVMIFCCLTFEFVPRSSADTFHLLKQQTSGQYNLSGTCESGGEQVQVHAAPFESYGFFR